MPRIDDQKTIALGPAEARHARTVLRLKCGDRIQIFDDAGRACSATLVEVEPDQVIARIESEVSATRELPVRLVCAAAWPKGSRLDWMLEKLCELGISEWIPLQCRRSLPPPSPNRFARLERIVREAAKQCGRSRVPGISKPVSPEALSATFVDNDCIYAASPEAKTSLLVETGRCRNLPSHVLFLIGPEGGFTEEELKALESCRAVPVSLGGPILRIETAAVAAASILTQSLSELWNRDSTSST